MYTVKLRNLTNEITEDDIRIAMSKFGEIIKVKIPMEELRNGKYRMYGFAFVTFKTTEEATKALEEAEINVDIATLEIERAVKRTMIQKDNPRVSEFEQLKRRT